MSLITFTSHYLNLHKNDLTITLLQLNASKEEIGEKDVQMLAIEEVNCVDPASEEA